MKRHSSMAILAVALSGLGVPSAQAGPCTAAIAQFEQAVRHAADKPNAGPLAPQSRGAQLDQQSTPDSVRRAQVQAQAAFQAQLDGAKQLDARGDDGCADALARAKDMFNLR